MKYRYSKYIPSLLLLIDLIIINTVTFFVLDKDQQNFFFYAYISVFWTISSVVISYYKVYRYTSGFKILNLLFKQITLFTLGFFAYFGLFKEGVVVKEQFNTLLVIVLFLVFVKVSYFFLIKVYRKLGNNYRKVVFLEKDKTTERMMNLFLERKDLGYTVVGFFTKKISESKLCLGNKDSIYTYVMENSIDEIYVTLSQTSKEEIKKLTKFSSDNNIQLKLIPNSNELYGKNQQVEVYEEGFKVLSIKKLPFEFAENRRLKRAFDIVFSFLVIVFLMSWLTPLLWVLIKLESKGPLFFKQEREGLKGERFFCYKFRSMKNNNEANIQSATKNDNRITKIGAFIRKTSIDELPQFFNVFLGNMSVVGPRPHMNVHSLKFEQEVTNYIKRYVVKPGITGLAQTRGYRGEIKKPSDIENRVRLDIFYIENWSFLFDVKIIINTVFNVFNGEENAY